MAKDSAGTLGQAGSKKMQTPLTAEFDRELPTALPDLLPQRRVLGHFYPVLLSPPSLGPELLLTDSHSLPSLPFHLPSARSLTNHAHFIPSLCPLLGGPRLTPLETIS